jgi:hypothetical protein
MDVAFRRAAIAVLCSVLGGAACIGARASEDLEHAAPPAREPAPAERQMFLRAKLATALSQLAPIKLMMTEHYMTMGVWPASPTELGLRVDDLTSSVIAGVTFGPEGTIVARLAPDIGEYAVLRLAPQTVMGGTSLEWRCSANLAAAVLRALPCEASQ